MDGREVVRGRGNRKEVWCGAAEEKQQPLIATLKLVVEQSGLRIPRIARLMGVGEATLSKWLDGTVQPTPKKLLVIESFLDWHGREYLENPQRRKESSR